MAKKLLLHLSKTDFDKLKAAKLKIIFSGKPQAMHEMTEAFGKATAERLGEQIEDGDEMQMIDDGKPGSPPTITEDVG